MVIIAESKTTQKWGGGELHKVITFIVKAWNNFFHLLHWASGSTELTKLSSGMVLSFTLLKFHPFAVVLGWLKHKRPDSFLTSHVCRLYFWLGVNKSRVSGCKQTVMGIWENFPFASIHVTLHCWLVVWPFVKASPVVLSSVFLNS